MAVIVVGGGGRGAGKTALVCGLIAALPEFAWTAVKITGHAHGKREPVWEEREAGQGTDTARYLAAGARQALLVTAGDDDIALRVRELAAMLGPGAHAIYESNRAVEHVRADVCLAVMGDVETAPKASFRGILERADALVVFNASDFVSEGAKLVFHLAALERVSPEMREWLRKRLGAVARTHSIRG
jgi:hypothetical protein